MKNLNCHIVRDLLPLYIDHACCDETAKDVEAHLQSCTSCQKLYNEMNTDFHSLLPEVQMDERSLFRHVKRSILNTSSPLLVGIFCLGLNLYGVVEGREASFLNLLLSVCYMLSWSFFIFHARKYRPLVNFSMAGSFTILLSAGIALAELPPGIATRLSDFLCFFAGVPFYGLRFYMSWHMTFIAAAVISLCWLLYACAVKFMLLPTESPEQHNRGGFCIKKRMALTIAFLVSLIPMLFNQYGGRRGVQEISGLINLLSPLGILSMCVFLMGVWGVYKTKLINRIMGLAGIIGMILSELYQFMTWHVLTITGEISLQSSISLAFPEFYIGLSVSAAMAAAFILIDKKIPDA